ncbi:inverse autotransporter beta domain-containing protein, partial [Planctomycetaceae bacterium]|nr:inverse autotransporter beta domain-containing protein [Planctomycetaceae bacterium]
MSPLVILGDEPPGEASATVDDSTAGVVRVIPAVDAVQAPTQPVERQLSPADDVLRVLPASGMGQGNSIVPRDKMVGMRFRLDRQAAGSGVVGNDVGDTSFDFFWPFEANGDDRFLFMDLRTQMNDQGRGGASTGMGYRSYNENLDRIFGLSGWWDWDNSHHRAYRQAGASFESLGQFFDFRANGYFPLSNEFHTVSDRTDYSNPQFGGFNVLVDRTRIFESNYRGADAEVGGPLPVLGRYGARGYMGIYHWSSETDADTTGWKARVETQVTDDLMIGVSVSDDSLFGTNTWLNVVLTLPDGRPETFFRPQTMRQRLNGSVRRNRRVVVNRRRQVDMVPVVNSSGANAGSPVQMVWIDPNAAFNGTGTYESPLNSLETFNNVPGNDMLIVGSGDLTGSVTLFDDQQLLSEWSLNQQQYNLATTAGLIPLPAADPMAMKPTFRNPLGVDGNDGGTIVSIAGSNTEIGGIIFDGQTDISGVYANAITTAPGWSIGGFNFHDNEFDRTRNSVVFNNSISSGAGYALGIFEQNQLRGNGFDSIAGFQLTATDGSLLNLRVDGNSVSNYRGEDLDSDGELDAGEDTNGNGVLDAGVAFSITASERAVINAVTIPGDPALPPLGITDNVAVSNGTGLLLLTETEGIINADVSGNTFNNNFDPNTGVSLTADNGTINLLSFQNNDVSDNLGVGMRLTASGGGTIAGVASEDRNRNGILDPTEDSNGNGLLDIGEDLNGNGVLDGAEDANGNGVLDHGFTGNSIIGNGGDGLVVVANDGTISNLSIGAASDLLPDDKVFDLLAEVDANGDGILNRGNGNGILDPGEDVNLNGLLDPGEDDNEDRNNNGIRDQVADRFIGALPGEDANGDGVLNVGNGNGVLDDGEDVNENGVLDLGEDFDEDFNGNGLLDGPDNVITGNGVTGSGGGSGVVLRTLPTEDVNGDGLLNVGNGNGTLDLGEDVNGNGLLDAGEDFDEDSNGNGRLDLGGGTITASLVNTFLDNTIVDIDGGTFLQNNTGSQLLIEADGGSSGSGSIILSSIANNSMTGAGLDSITIDSNNAGSVLIGEIKNSTLDNNARNGINVESDTGAVSLGMVDSNTFNRIYNGVDGIHIETDDAIVTGIVTRSRFQADPVGNINEDANDNGVLDLGEDLNGNGLLESGAGIGFVVRATGGNTSLEIGQTDLGNVFDQNAGTAIEYTLIEGGQGQVAIRDNQIRGTTAIDTDGDGVGDTGGDGIVVRTLGDIQGGVGNPVLHDSIIDGNLIGSLVTTEDTNGNSLLDPGEDINGNGLLDLSLVNEGHGVRFDIQEQSTVSNVWIGYADAGDDS